MVMVMMLMEIEAMMLAMFLLITRRLPLLRLLAYLCVGTAVVRGVTVAAVAQFYSYSRLHYV